VTGSHTIGRAKCTSFRPRIYNESSIDSCFAKSLQRKCPVSGNDNKLVPLDVRTSTHFDIQYYKNLLNKKGLLHSDQELYNGTSADSLVKKYSTHTAVFFKDFARAMVKMGKIKPLTGSKGEIRINCRKVN
jgi:peroxidase